MDSGDLISLATMALIAFNANLATFHPFSRLAPEIRKLIWMFALPRERHVFISSSHFINSQGNHFWDRFGTKFSLRLPTTLHVNSESRGITLEHYVIYWQQMLQHNFPNYRPIFFDPMVDIICIQSAEMYAITDRLQQKQWGEMNSLLKYIHKFKILEIRDVGGFDFLISLLHDEAQTARKILKAFRYVREIRLIGDPGSSNFDFSTKINDLRAVLMEIHQNSSRFTLPAITSRSYYPMVE